MSRRASISTVSGSRHPEVAARSIAAISAAGHAAVRQQDSDQGAGSLNVAARESGCIPIALMRCGEHPAGLRLYQCGRTGRRPGLGLEDLQVVIQAQHLGVASVNGQVEVPAGGQIKVPTPCGDFYVGGGFSFRCWASFVR
jgi:hypothetical protein